jgi:queuine tRNA-ribosyltransferase
MSFELLHTSTKSKARTGVLHTDHGDIQTPIFMPVGTLGTVKKIQQYDLAGEIDADIILGNTYHLYLRPGMDLMEKAGGLHRFMNWQRPILTDSGGYQVYSLGHRRKITEQGVTFASHIDGSKHVFTPESVMDIQRVIGADIIMAFDECTPYPCEYDYAKASMHMTHRWLDRCITQYDGRTSSYGHVQILAPIVQGSVYPDLRRQSAEYISEKESEIYAIGGLSVGEPHEDMYSMTDLCTSILPDKKARYLMGVGTPANLLECIDRGIDMFDCVLPTRNARHGLIYTDLGMINLKNAKWKSDFSPLDPNGTHQVDIYYTKAYLRHLFNVGESLGPQITSLHNIAFFLNLMRQAREHILNDTFEEWKVDMVERVTRRL